MLGSGSHQCGCVYCFITQPLGVLCASLHSPPGTASQIWLLTYVLPAPLLPALRQWGTHLTPLSPALLFVILEMILTLGRES